MEGIVEAKRVRYLVIGDCLCTFGCLVGNVFPAFWFCEANRLFDFVLLLMIRFKHILRIEWISMRKVSFHCRGYE